MSYFFFRRRRAIEYSPVLFFPVILYSCTGLLYRGHEWVSTKIPSTSQGVWSCLSTKGISLIFFPMRESANIMLWAVNTTFCCDPFVNNLTWVYLSMKLFQRKSRRYYPTRLAINLASAGIGNSHFSLNLLTCESD